MVLVFLGAGFIVGILSALAAFVMWNPSATVLLAIYSVAGSFGAIGAAFLQVMLSARNRRKQLATENTAAPFARTPRHTSDTVPVHGTTKG